jgi:selenocysteine lyase/cysteine desulfurase
MEISEARGLWSPKSVYLDSATYGLPPQPAWDALQTALDEWRHGKTIFWTWDEAVGGSRRAFARLVGVPVEWVCVSASVSALTGLVAASLPTGSTVVAPDIEFTSNLWPWMLHEHRGVSVRTVPVEHLPESIDDSVDLVAVSLVQSATGEVVDLDPVVEAARLHGARVFVDATQACGWLPVDAARMDYLVCAPYKWLMSPRGTAFMTVSPERLPAIRPLLANWYAGEVVADSYYGPPVRLASSARRLDLSPAWFSWVGTRPALELIEEIGMERIHTHDVALANRFRAGLGLAESNSAIVRVGVPDAAERLERAGIRAAVRAGQLRASFHVYNTESDVDSALEALDARR